jgi:hypothetical protein
VEEFIVEIEGPSNNCDVTRWGKFADIRDIKKEMFQRLEVQSRTCSILDPAGLDLAILFTMRIRSNASELLDQR